MSGSTIDSGPNANWMVGQVSDGMHSQWNAHTGCLPSTLSAECIWFRLCCATPGCSLFRFVDSHSVRVVPLLTLALLFTVLTLTMVAHSHDRLQFAGKRFMNIGWSTGGPPMTDYVDAAPGLQITLICDLVTVTIQSLCWSTLPSLFA